MELFIKRFKYCGFRMEVASWKSRKIREEDTISEIKGTQDNRRRDKSSVICSWRWLRINTRNNNSPGGACLSFCDRNGYACWWNRKSGRGQNRYGKAFSSSWWDKQWFSKMYRYPVRLYGFYASFPELKGLKMFSTSHRVILMHFFKKQRNAPWSHNRLAEKPDVLDLAGMTGHRDLKMLIVYYNATAEKLAEKFWDIPFFCG